MWYPSQILIGRALLQRVRFSWWNVSGWFKLSLRLFLEERCSSRVTSLTCAGSSGCAYSGVASLCLPPGGANYPESRRQRLLHFAYPRSGPRRVRPLRSHESQTTWNGWVELVLCCWLVDGWAGLLAGWLTDQLLNRSIAWSVTGALFLSFLLSFVYWEYNNNNNNLAQWNTFTIPLIRYVATMCYSFLFSSFTL